MPTKWRQRSGKLLNGQRDKVTLDKATGQMTIEHIVDDLETMAAGVDLYKKTTALEEKPAAPSDFAGSEPRSSGEPPGKIRTPGFRNGDF
jgi:hypothetical protein